MDGLRGISLYSNHCRILGSAVAVQPCSDISNTVGIDGSAGINESVTINLKFKSVQLKQE